MPNPKKNFSEIYNRYVDKIYRFIFLKVSSQEVAEDLASETFLKTWETYKNGNPEIENIQAFLYKTARNLVIDYYRGKGKAKIVSADYRPIIDPKQNLEEKAFLNSDIENIKQALANLKEDYQDVIIWYYLDDLPISEISQMLDRTEEATRVLLHRALNALKNELS